MDIKRLSLYHWLLALIVFLIGFQRSYVFKFPIGTFPHAACPYNHIKYAFFDLLLLLLFPFVLRNFKTALKDRATQLLLAFFALCTLSIFTHTYATHLLPLWFLLKLFGATLLFFALAAEATKPEREAFFKMIQYAVVIAATLQASIALIQFLHQGSLGLKFLGEGVINGKHGGGSSFPITAGSWLLFKGASEIFRAQGTLDHPNHIGILLVVGLTTLFSLYLQAARRERLLLIAPFILLLFGLVATFSRAALFTWVLSLLIALPLLGRNALPLLKLTLPLFLLAAALFLPLIQSRGGILNSNPVNQFADRERITYMQDAAAMIKAHPLNGVGFHNYITRLDEFSPGPNPDHRPLIVHNVFLLLFAELGLPGILLAAALWALLLIRAYQSRHHPTATLFGSLLFALLFYASCDIFLLSEPQGQLTLFLTLALATAATPSGVPAAASVNE